MRVHRRTAVLGPTGHPLVPWPAVASHPTAPLLSDQPAQGKPVARRGRKARDLQDARPGDRPVAGLGRHHLIGRSYDRMKSTAIRVALALAALTATVLTLAAGQRWN